MPVVLEPLLELGVWALVFLVVSLALAAAVIMAAIASAASHIPAIGGAISSLINACAQAITSACGKLMGGIDRLVGASWHLLARYADELWHSIEGQAHLIAQIAQIVGSDLAHLTGISSLVRRLEKVWHGIEHGIRTLTREFHGIERRVRAIERSIAQGIGHDLRIQVKALEREVATIENQVVPELRSAVNTAEADVTALQKWVTANFPAVGTEAFVGAIAVALASLGLGGLRCSNFTGLLGKYACGLGRLIDDLLGLMVAGLALEAVCEFLPLLEAAFGAVVGPITHLLNEVPLGACEQVPQGWSVLNVSAGPLPPAQTLGTFPS